MRSTELLLDEDEGLFRCNRCGDCCRGRDVPLTLDDVFRLGELLGMDPDHFFAEFCTEVIRNENTTPLPFLKKDVNGCCFLDDGLCRVHLMRPWACEHIPSTIFGSLEYARTRMPPGCAIQHSWLVDAEDKGRLRRNYMTATMLTTIYYSKFGTFKYEHAKPFIYRILLFNQNRDQVFKLVKRDMPRN